MLGRDRAGEKVERVQELRLHELWTCLKICSCPWPTSDGHPWVFFEHLERAARFRTSSRSVHDTKSLRTTANELTTAQKPIYQTLHLIVFSTFLFFKSNLFLISILNLFIFTAVTRQPEAICLALLSLDLQRKDHPLRVRFLLFKSIATWSGP